MQKKLLTRFLLLPMVWLGTATLAPAATIVSGHVVHPKGQGVVVILKRDPLTREPLSQVVAKLDAKGDFRLELPKLTQATEATFAHGDEFTTLFLTPGDNLCLTLDTQEFDKSLRFTGTGAAANTYLSQSYLRFDADYEATPLAKVGSNTPDQMQQLIEADRQQRLAYLKTYAASHPLTPTFRAFARQAITFAWANSRLYLPNVYQEVAKGPVVLPATYYDFLPKLRPLQDSALAMNNGNYLNFLEVYAANRLAAPGELPSGEAMVKAAEQQFGVSPSRDVMLAKFVYNAFYDYEATALTPLLPALQRSLRDSSLVRTVRTKYQRRLLLSAGREAPGVAVRDAAGKAVSLADFKGKVVYLDFWASWCGPCLAEVPASTTLKKQFEGKDVVFLYISIDDDEASWKKALAKHPLASANSVHSWTKGFGAPTPTNYQIDGIPAYFIIGRDGRLTTGRAPRPSEGEAAVGALNQALGK